MSAMDDGERVEFMPLEVADAETRQLLGMFDTPAFARRGHDLELGLERLHARLGRERAEMLEMVRLRLRQWAAVVDGPHAWALAFAGPIEPLWDLADAEPPRWADRPAPPRRLRAVARDLAASVGRFNRRWQRVLDALDLGPINRLIEQYNRYYLLEKECSLGSSRLAGRGFEPRLPVTPESLRLTFPPLPEPALRSP